MGGRQVIPFLPRIADAQSQKTSGGDGVLGVNGLVAYALRVSGRAIAICGQNTTQAVRAGNRQCTDHNHRAQYADSHPFAGEPDDQKGHASDEDQNHGRAEVPAAHHQRHAYRIQRQRRGICFDSLLVVHLAAGMQRRGKPYAHRELHEFGRLDSGEAEVQPTSVAVDVVTQRSKGQRLQQAGTHHKEHAGPFPERHRHHQCHEAQHQADQAKRALVQKLKERRLAQCGHGDRGAGEHHDQAEACQPHHGHAEAVVAP